MPDHGLYTIGLAVTDARSERPEYSGCSLARSLNPQWWRGPALEFFFTRGQRGRVEFSFISIRPIYTIALRQTSVALGLYHKRDKYITFETSRVHRSYGSRLSSFFFYYRLWQINDTCTIAPATRVTLGTVERRQNSRVKNSFFSLEWTNNSNNKNMYCVIFSWSVR